MQLARACTAQKPKRKLWWQLTGRRPRERKNALPSVGSSIVSKKNSQLPKCRRRVLGRPLEGGQAGPKSMAKWVPHESPKK